MKHFLIAFVALCQTTIAQSEAPEASPPFKERGTLILKEVLEQDWAKGWRGASLKNPTVIEQKPDLAHPTGLPPVWHATVEGPKRRKGYLMWDCSGEGRLVEFALDDELEIPGTIKGLPALQQFQVLDEENRPMASGCVPTSAASLVSFWMSGDSPVWKEDPKPAPDALAQRLRNQLRMFRYPDTDGFTKNGMALAGASPARMAAVINDETKKRDVPLAAHFSPFSIAEYRRELEAGRPALLSCTVRVPHKPALSWRHAVVGIASAQLDGVDLVGIHDNFYPSQNAGTIRWIRSDAFHSLTQVQPRGE